MAKQTIEITQLDDFSEGFRVAPRRPHKGALTRARSKVEPKKQSKGAGRTKVTSDMPTEKGQRIFEQMRRDGFYDVANFDMSLSYLSNIMSNIRELGYELHSIRDKNQRVIRYELDTQ